MRTIGFLVPVALLCAALAAQVADVVEAARKSTAAAPRGASTAAAAHQAGPPSKTTTLTASSLPAAHPSAAAKGLATDKQGPAQAADKTTAVDKTTAADRKKVKPHRATATPISGASGGGRRPGGSGEEGGAETGRTAVSTAPGTPAQPEAHGDGDSGPDAAAPKSSSSNKSTSKQAAYPFLVAVQKVCGGCQTRHICGGVLLAPQWVLTAAPCAETHPGEYLTVRAGESFIWPGGLAATQKVVEVVWHEAVTSTDDYPRYDLILLRLENPFTFGEFINAINLAPPSYVTEGAVSVVGWSPPGTAQQIEVNVTHASVRPTDECVRIAPQETLPADTLCALPVEPFPEKCSYDLGDPVIVDGDSPLLVGLLSRWYQPCGPERPVAAIKVSIVFAWIYEKVPDLAPAPVPVPNGPGSADFWPQSLCCGPWKPWKPRTSPRPGSSR